MAYIESDSDPSVKSLIQKSLVDNTSPQILLLLLDQNRKLQKELNKLDLYQTEQAFLPDSNIRPAAMQAMANLLYYSPVYMRLRSRSPKKSIAEGWMSRLDHPKKGLMNS
jgi:hypothetical protein